MDFQDFIGMIGMQAQTALMESEQNKTNFNVMFRILYEKGIFTEEDIIESFKKEYKTLYELGTIKEIPNDEMINMCKDNLIMWLKSNSNEIKRKAEEMRKSIEKNNNMKIDVVGADALTSLNNMSKNKSKLII